MCNILVLATDATCTDYVDYSFKPHLELNVGVFRLDCCWERTCTLEKCIADV